MSTGFERLIPDYIQALPVYIPGKPIEEVERELKVHAIKLASNENALGPSPMAVEAIYRAAGESNRYPDGGAHALRETLARHWNVSPEQIFIGLGSSEIIDLASRVLLREGLQGLTSEGSYAPFSIAIRMNRGELKRVPLRNWAYDLEALAEAITPATRIVYIANPNNPTGTAVGAAELAKFLRCVREDICVVLDEAYLHYAARSDMPRSEDLVREFKNLMVLRTFSKVYGLAGMRIGFAIADEALVAAMNKLKTPFNVSGLAQAAAIAALYDMAHVKRCVEDNARERARLVAGLREMGLNAVPSETNFVFVDFGFETAALCEELLRRGVILRPLAWMGMPKALRISVGTREENEKCLHEMRVVLRSAQSKA